MHAKAKVIEIGEVIFSQNEVKQGLEDIYPRNEKL